MILAAGLPVPADLPGRELTDRPSLEARTAVFLEHYGQDIADISNPATSLLSRGVLSGPWKLLIASPTADGVPGRKDMMVEPVELDHVVQDPFESENVAAREPERVAELRRYLDAWWNPAVR